MADPIPSKHSTPCSELISITVRLTELEKDVAQNAKDIRSLLEFMAGIKMLQSLSIGGGALSILTLILLIIELSQRAIP